MSYVERIFREAQTRPSKEKGDQSWMFFWASSTDCKEKHLIKKGMRMQGKVKNLPQQTHAAQLR